MKKAPAKKTIKKKETTIEDLAVMMSKGFHDVNTKIDEDINNLATMVAKGFESVDKRFESVDKRFEDVDKRFDKIEKRLENVGEDLKLKATRQDMLNFGDRFVLKYEFSDLTTRVGRLERRIKI